MTPKPRGGNFGVKSIKSMYFLKNLLYSGSWSIQTKCIVMMTKEGSTKIINFMTPVRASCARSPYCENALFLLESSLHTGIDQTNWVYSDDQGRVYQNCKLNYPWTRGSCAGACNISPLLVYARTWIRQIKDKAIMTKEGSTKIVNFITIGVC